MTFQTQICEALNKLDLIKFTTEYDNRGEAVTVLATEAKQAQLALRFARRKLHDLMEGKVSPNAEDLTALAWELGWVAKGSPVPAEDLAKLLVQYNAAIKVFMR